MLILRDRDMAQPINRRPFHDGSPGSNPAHSTWYLCWTNWHRYSSATNAIHPPSSTRCSYQKDKRTKPWKPFKILFYKSGVIRLRCASLKLLYLVRLYRTCDGVLKQDGVTFFYFNSSTVHLFYYFVLWPTNAHNYFTNYHIATCFDTVVSSSDSL
jgi:hypothetical protein